MKKITFVIILYSAFFICINAQIKVGGNPKNIDSSAMFEIETTKKGFLLPRMSSTQRINIIKPAQGLEVYDTITKSLWYYNGSIWVENGGKNIYTENGTLTTNRIVDLNNKFLTFDNGNVGIGTNTPITRLESRFDANSSLTDAIMVRNDGVGVNTGTAIAMAGGNTTWGRLVMQNGIFRVRNYSTGLDVLNVDLQFSNVGIGNIAPTTRLDARATSGDGAIGIGTSSQTPSGAGAGAIRYNPSGGGTLFYSNGSAWNQINAAIQKSVVTGFFTSGVNYAGGTAILNCTETADINGSFSSNSFIAPRTGIYLITANLLTTSKSWSTGEELSISIGGVASFFGAQTNYTGFGGPSFSAAISLLAGQSINFSKYSGASFTSHGSSFNRFSIVEL